MKYSKSLNKNSVMKFYFNSILIANKLFIFFLFLFLFFLGIQKQGRMAWYTLVCNISEIFQTFLHQAD